MAKVNGETINRGLMDFMIKNVVRQGAEVPPGQHDKVRHDALNELIKSELVYQKAKASQVSISDTEFAESMAKIKANFPDEKAFAAELAKDGMSLGQVESMVRRSMIVDKYVRSSIVTKVKISPEDEAKFYQENKEKMKHPEQVRASHILRTVMKGATEEAKAAQKASAIEALTKARRGDDFTALAKQLSQDSGSRENGGDLGFFGKGQMVPAFETAVWTLKVGEISPVTETPFGFHVIKLTARRPEGYLSIDDVREQVRQYLTSQKVQGELQALTEVLRAQAKIETKL